MFSSTSKHGPVPTETQIRSFWARYKTSIEKKLSETHNKDDVEEWVEDALHDNAIGDDAILLDGIKFYLLGEFPDVEGGVEMIKAKIKEHGAKVGKKLTKTISKLCVKRYSYP